MSATTITTPRTDLVILRAWRDGSVHAEVPTASFGYEDGETAHTHVWNVWVDGHKTLCDAAFWGRASVTTWAGPHVVTCEKCRKLLLGAPEESREEQERRGAEMAAAIEGELLRQAADDLGIELIADAYRPGG